MELSGRIFVTGGAGYLARGMYARALRSPTPWRAQFTCYSRDDAKHALLQARFPEVHCYRGDVAYDDVTRLAELMRGHDIVIHAAAEKYVDRSEFEGPMTAHTNVVGSLNVLRAATMAGVGTVIGISTDKACQPANTYGLTKAVMERIFSTSVGPRCVTVRYGNVIASTGSVIPLFRKQLMGDGFVTLTDPAMTRFWMTVDDAIDVICRAFYSCERGEMLIPRPKSATVAAVAAAAAEQMGKEFHCRVVGLRAGEKLHEFLLSETESRRIRVGAVHPRDGWVLGPPGTNQNPDPFEVNSESAERLPDRWLVKAIEESLTV